jgi:hypothetical protein
MVKLPAVKLAYLDMRAANALALQLWCMLMKLMKLL